MSYYAYPQLLFGGAKGIVATGGTITYAGGYKIHTFTSGGTFQVLSGSGSVDYLIVGGGGGSGGSYGGGGGAAGQVKASSC